MAARAVLAERFSILIQVLELTNFFFGASFLLFQAHVRAFPNGIAVTTFVDIYASMFGHELIAQDYGKPHIPPVFFGSCTI